MTATQGWNPDQVRAMLTARGYDIDPGAIRYGGNSLSARRERAGAAQLFVIDSSGQFRAELTVMAGENRRSTMIGPVPVVVVSQQQRVFTVTGQLPAWHHLPAVLTQLDTLN
jgi:hypothetical protein